MTVEIGAFEIGLAVSAVLFGAVTAYAVLSRPMRRNQARIAELDETIRRDRAEAELHRGTVLLQAKEAALELRQQVEADLSDRQAALTKLESKLERRQEQLETLEAEVRERMAKLEQDEALVRTELNRLAGLGPEEAKAELMRLVESEFRELAQARAHEIESEAVGEAERRAKRILVDTMQRTVVDYVTEATLAVVELPSEDMKGRIIGREGRNIRAFEQVTGVDLIIDETPEAVVISCFDPVRRETARLALMNLMVDGRIHPGRIEELYEKAKVEVDRMVRDAGERATDRANVAGLPPMVVEMMGRLRFRTSYAQNVLDHSVEVSRLAANLAAELGLNVEVAKRAGLLHDIGKALGPEFEGPHALTGMQYLNGFGEKEIVLNAVGAHHYEIEPASPEAMLVIVADTISAARPGARRESLENYIKRLTKLEALANDFPGVERSYALQAGREIRLIVRPTEVDDLGAARLARDVAKRIETELDYPGQIRVTVIRETRASETAK